MIGGRVEKKSQFMCHKIRIDFVIIYGGVTMEEFSDKFKLKMNRVFREQAGIKTFLIPKWTTYTSEYGAVL